LLRYVDFLQVTEDGCGAVEHGGHGLFQGFCALGTWDAVWVTWMLRR